jgi:hypothetical protein
VNPRIISINTHAIVAALCIVAAPPLARAQQPARVTATQGTKSHDHVSPAGVSRAIDLSAHYL